MSFLCDRDTTAVAQSQPGFVNFIVAPLFSTLCDLMPNLTPLLESAKSNAAKWKDYEETEKDKAIYKQYKKLEIKADNLSSNSLGDEDCVTTPVDLS